MHLPFLENRILITAWLEIYGTVKLPLLVRVLLGVTTTTEPVVAPVGTVVVISELETTVNVAAVPLNVTVLES